MQRTLRNTVAVLVVTAFTALAIFAAVQLTGRLVAPANAAGTQTYSTQTTPYGSSSSSSDSSSGQLVCPATGCAAESCHATQ